MHTSAVTGECMRLSYTVHVHRAAVDAGKMEKTQVTMVGWEMTDSFLVSATTPDCHVRVWRSTTGEHIQTLKVSNQVHVLYMVYIYM